MFEWLIYIHVVDNKYQPKTISLSIVIDNQYQYNTISSSIAK